MPNPRNSAVEGSQENILAEQINAQVATIAAENPGLARRLRLASIWSTLGFIVAGGLLTLCVLSLDDRTAWKSIVSGASAAAVFMLTRMVRNASIGTAMMIGALAVQRSETAESEAKQRKKSELISAVETGVALAKLDRQLTELQKTKNRQ